MNRTSAVALTVAALLISAALFLDRSSAVVVDAGNRIAVAPPTPAPSPPILGNYPDTTVVLGANTIIVPSASPILNSNIQVTSSSTDFHGILTADPTTGIVRITNAHHASRPGHSFPIVVRAVGPGGGTTRTFRLTVTNGNACTQIVSFVNTGTVPLGSFPISVAIGDITNNGIQDIAVANRSGNTFSTRMGNGQGGFNSGSLNLPLTTPNSVVLGDLNGDGFQDLAIGTEGAHRLALYWGGGLNNFIPGPNFNPGSISIVAVTDFNQDGATDLISAAFLGGFNIWFGDGRGGFSAGPSSGPGGYVATGDFNNDGFPDLAIGANPTDTVYVILNDGAGGIGPVTTLAGSASVSGVAVGDFNLDGHQDLAITYSESALVAIRSGDGTGGFAEPTYLNVDNSPSSVAVGDFNNDDKQDLAVTHDIGEISILFGDGSGQFDSRQTYSAPISTNRIAVGDFNLDGRQDLITTAYSNAAIATVFLGRCAGPTPTPTPMTPTPTPTPTPFTPSPTPSPSCVVYKAAVPLCPSPSVTPTLGTPLPTQTPTPITPTPTLSPGVTPSPGRLDTSLNGIGTNITPIGQYSSAHAVAIQPDGKIVTAGLSENDFALARYNSDGALDSSFGSGGIVTTSISFSNDIGNDVIILPDGKILAIGDGVVALTNRFTLIRYEPSGALDNSFGNGGIVTTAIQQGEHGYAGVLQPDGKIVVAGSSWNGLNSDFALIRYNSDGSLDGTFGTAGKVVTEVTWNDWAYDVALQSDGRIVVAGFTEFSSTQEFALVRYTENGTMDWSFGAGGKALIDISPYSEAAKSVIVQEDGKILVTGHIENRSFATVRYNSDGSLDTSFSGGVVMTQIGGTTSGASALVVQCDGKIVVGGAGGGGNFAFAAYNTDGTLDITFGAGGTLATGVGGGGSSVNALVLQPNGRVVAAGWASDRFAIARYFGSVPCQMYSSGRPGFDYDGDSRSDVSVFRPGQANWYLLRSREGFAAANFGLSTDRIAPADFDGDGKTDIGVYRPSQGVWYWLNSSTGTLNAVPFGTSEDLPTPADYDGDGHADVSVFRPSNGVWYRLNSSNGSFYAVQFGVSEDKPTIGDYDGDGRADVAVWRPSNGAWYRLNSSNGAFVAVAFGLSDDLITPADFDGDGKTDVAVYRASTGTWYSLDSSNGALRATQFGTSEDVPTAADFDGDGRADVSVFRPSDGVWYRLNSSTGAFVAIQFGTNGDRPTPAAFRY